MLKDEEEVLYAGNVCWNRSRIGCKADSKDAGMYSKIKKKCCMLAMYVRTGLKIVQKENAVDVVR